MSFPAILLLALGLALDATAVSVARGLAAPRLGVRHFLLVAGFFGGFQALMPLIGWVAGMHIGPMVEAWDHWVAFVLLGAIGAKMIWEALRKKDGEAPAAGDPFALRVMTLLAIATSIDALAVGITLPMLEAPMLLSLATIGITTAVLSALGLYAGRRFGAVFGNRLEIAGGLVLIGLGVKFLLQR